MYQAEDPTVLAWAAQENCILLTHDISTIPGYKRVEAGERMPGVIAAHRDTSIGRIIEDLLVIIGASDPAE